MKARWLKIDWPDPWMSATWDRHMLYIGGSAHGSAWSIYESPEERADRLREAVERSEGLVQLTSGQREHLRKLREDVERVAYCRTTWWWPW